MGKDFLIYDQLQGKKTDHIPFWFMRQAGRYLPEYKKVRASSKDFLDLCYSPEKACEVTLQPIRRYGMDAAIIFSDILVVPDALGVNVTFEENHGPRLVPVKNHTELSFSGFEEKLHPVYEAIKKTCAELPSETALFGFCGSPWTLACYMIEGGGSKDFSRARSFAITHQKIFSDIIDILTEAVSKHLIAQVNAGADILQLFDSWAGIATEKMFDDYITKPTKKIVDNVKKACPKKPLIGFARNAGHNIFSYAKTTGLDGVSLDMNTPLSVASELQKYTLVQGNLDPLLLAYDIDEAITQTKIILQATAPGKIIFNLGHGIIPQTPPDNVARLCDVIREFRL